MLTRRSFLRASMLGLAGVTLGAHPLGSRAFGSAVGTTTTLTAGTVHLTMRECLMEMVDETRVYMWAFDSPEAGLRVPGPVIYATEGAEVAVAVTNDLARTHAFSIPGVAHSGPIAPGATVQVAFTAPVAGTYLYLDPMHAPMHRAMGLAGAFVVLPAGGDAPYTTLTPALRNLFDDLGTIEHFPGDPWRPERSWVWVFSSVDPVAHQRVWEDPDLPADAFAEEYLPRYFMLNGRSGFFAGNDPASHLHGRVGQPALIRSVNVGMMTHSPHIHGNHVYVLAVDGQVQDNVIAHDTWELTPLSTTDVLHPFTRPPDAYPWPPSDPSVWTTDLAGDGHRGMVYPIHCHAELSLLANGGNYPQGLITHWTLEGDLAGAEPPSGDPPDDDPPDEPHEEPPEEPGGPGRGRTGAPGRPDDRPRPSRPGSAR